jgi:hypothetical protein
MEVAPEPDRAEVIDVTVRQIRPKRRRPGLVTLVAGSVVSVGTRTARAAWRITGETTRRVASGPTGRAVQRAAGAALGESAEEGIRELRHVADSTIDTIAELISAVLPRTIRSLDIDALLDMIDLDSVLARIDVNAVLERIRVNAVLDRIDVDRLLDRMDIDRLLDRVSVNSLLDRVDVDALLDRADVDALLDRVDVDRLLSRVDVDAILDRVDVEGLVVRARVGDIVARSTGQVAGSALDVGRRQAVGLDALVLGLVNRVMRREAGSVPRSPPELTPRAEDESQP